MGAEGSKPEDGLGQPGLMTSGASGGAAERPPSFGKEPVIAPASPPVTRPPPGPSAADGDRPSAAKPRASATSERRSSHTGDRTSVGRATATPPLPGTDRPSPSRTSASKPATPLRSSISLPPGVASMPAGVPGTKKLSAPTSPGTDKSWRMPRQDIVSAATVPKSSTSGTHRASYSGSINSSMSSTRPSAAGGGLLGVADRGAQQAHEAAEAEQRQFEESKREMLNKLTSFIRRPGAGASRGWEPASMALPKAAGVAEDEVKKQGWLTKLKSSKAETLERIKDQLGKGKHLDAMSQEDLGPKVSESLGEDLDTFSGFQGTVHRVIEQGLDGSTLEGVLFDEEDERQLTTYSKWQVIKHAAEQLLQVYANRSNSRWIEQEAWRPPVIIDANTISTSVYTNNVDAAISQGNIALLFIDDDRLTEINSSSVAPILSTDLWQPIKELAPNRVPAGQRLERLSIAGRHLLNAAVSVETWYGAVSLRKLKVVLAVDSEQEQFMVTELQQWNFFGLHHANVAILPLPRFHGFAQDQRTKRLAHVKGSARLLLGTGYAMFLLNSPAEAYTLSADGTEPQCLAGSVLDWLAEQKARWVFSGLFSDIERLRPEALFDQDFLAAAMYAVDRCGANMAMEVVAGDHERDARTYDSIVLAHGPSQETGNCNLRASAMRTVKSYQILQNQVANARGFYLSTHRYIFKTSALQKLMVDASAFHADVRLHGFYAYATFDLGDITTFADANCAAILGQGLKGPNMSEAVHGKAWLAYAAGILESQDKVKEFRQKAVDVVHYEKLMQKRPEVLVHNNTAGPVTTGFKEKRGRNVVLLLSPEHTKSARMAFKMARLFMHQIVDRLHLVVVVMGDSCDSRDKAAALMEELDDKELEYGGQLLREVVVRTQDQRTSDVINDFCIRAQADLLVVPSEKLVNHGDANASVLSLAYLVARNITAVQVLVVKVNSIGKFASSVSPNEERRSAPESANSKANLQRAVERRHSEAHGGGREPLVVMVHLEGAAVAPMVEEVTRHLVPGHDRLFLAKTTAFEKSGQLSMRSRRVFVQARMACAAQLRVEERAYTNNATQELSKAVEAEGVDMLVVSVNGERPISKDIDELLKTVKSSVLIFRFKEPTSNTLTSAPVVQDMP